MRNGTSLLRERWPLRLGRMYPVGILERLRGARERGEALERESRASARRTSAYPYVPSVECYGVRWGNRGGPALALHGLGHAALKIQEARAVSPPAPAAVMPNARYRARQREGWRAAWRVESELGP